MVPSGTDRDTDDRMRRGQQTALVARCALESKIPLIREGHEVESSLAECCEIVGLRRIYQGAANEFCYDAGRQWKHNGSSLTLRTERNRINVAIAAFEALDGTGRRRGRPAGSTAGPSKRGRRRMSADARRRIAAAMRARWAAKRKKGARPQQKTAAKQKRRGGITAAGRKRLSGMMKKR
jgi:hypothetical protein